MGHQLSVIDLTDGLKAVGHGDPAIVKRRHDCVWRDDVATQIFAQSLAASPHIRNAFIALHGELGAGKTTFVRHLLRALGVPGRIKSPTYAVVEPYEVAGLSQLGQLGQLGEAVEAVEAVEGQGSFNIWHFDFYRFSDPREWADAGFRDLFASPGLKLAEWPQNVAAQLPVADLALHLMVLPDESRGVSVTAHSATGLALLRAVAP